MEFNMVCCGGTFDHFHKGHREFLKTAFHYGEMIVIGITSDKYVKNIKYQISNIKYMETYESRKSAVFNFLKQEKVLDRVEIVPIDDLFGPTLDKDFKEDTLLISETSINSAKIINKKRGELGLKLLKVIVQKLVKAPDGKPISSSRIREGEIDREGKLYINPLWLRKKLFITNSLRKILAKPLGKLTKTISCNKKKEAGITAAVGDVTVKMLNEVSFGQEISLIDFKIEREERLKDVKELGFSGNETLVTVSNPPGTITPNLFKSVLQAVALAKKKRQIILKINGEEDLSVLPLILSLPLGSVIFYGQRKKGLVQVEVSERQKEKVRSLIGQFHAQK